MLKSDGLLSAKEAEDILRAHNGWPDVRVAGVLAPRADLLPLPPNLDVEALDLTKCPSIDELPSGLRCFELNLSGTAIRTLPPDLRVKSILNLEDCAELTELPRGLAVGTLILRNCRSLEALPEELDVWFLDLTGCWNFSRWPKQATIRSGRLNLRGCAALHCLPGYLGPLAALNVRDCPNLRQLPEGLDITGWIDVAQSGLADTKVLPASLRNVQLRWQGVRIEERIILRPETITCEEIQVEDNAERRRVLLDRFGIARFVKATETELLDQDRDAGGERQLLRTELKDDEPLVGLSCFCPSTGRHYFLRVPPDTETCHQAAAWIAGFDNPDEYEPLVET